MIKTINNIDVPANNVDPSVTKNVTVYSRLLKKSWNEDGTILFIEGETFYMEDNNKVVLNRISKNLSVAEVEALWDLVKSNWDSNDFIASNNLVFEEAHKIVLSQDYSNIDRNNLETA